MRGVRALLAGALLLSAAPAARAVRPITPPAPEFPKNAAWINSLPFTMKRLKNRRVVIITFLNFYSINSIRTIPWLNRIWDQYALKGLMIIAVHSPDYAFDRDPSEIRRAAERLGVRFPVFVDGAKRLWKTYRNTGWPAHFLVNHKGLIVHDWLGEGGHAEFEHEILLALGRMGQRPPRNYEVPADKKRRDCATATKAFYLGARRGKELKKISPRKIHAIIESRDGEAAVHGKWTIEADGARFKGDRKRLNSRLQVIYHGAEALPIMARMGPRPARVYVKQDGLWLHSGNANTDVKWDDDDRSYVLVDHPRLYYLTRNRKRRMYELTLFPDEAGVVFSGFEFSDRCQTDYAHK